MEPVQVPKKDLRLPVFRNATHIVAIGVGIFYGFLVYKLGGILPDLRHAGIVLWTLIAAAVYTIAITWIEIRFKWKKGLYIANIGWIIIYILIVYGTGGAKSPLLFLFFVPVITTAWNLDSKVTKRVIFTMLIAAALMLFADQEYINFGFIMQYYLIQVAAMAIVMYYIYKLLSETLLQKYEKEEAKKRYDELMEIDRLKTDFVTMVSHQLRTPLTGARWGLASLSEKEAIPQETKTLIKQPQERINDSVKIVDEIINSVETGAGILKKEWEVVNLAEIIRKAAEKFRHLADINKVLLKINEPTRPIAVKGSKEMLMAAFSNIIDNSVHYAPGGEVIIDISSEEKDAVVKIRDNGIGIPEEDKPHIFERFYRSKSAMRTEPSGSGIGLYISKKIIERHGGIISFKSAQGKGTEITVKIPMTGSESEASGQTK